MPLATAQLPCPLQVSERHAATFAAHAEFGSCPAPTLLQMPTEPGALQILHPLQSAAGVSQHTPSTQFSVMHWVSATHSDPPPSLFAHMLPPMQYVPFGQPASEPTVQLAAQRLPLQSKVPHDTSLSLQLPAEHIESTCLPAVQELAPQGVLSATAHVPLPLQCSAVHLVASIVQALCGSWFAGMTVQVPTEPGRSHARQPPQSTSALSQHTLSVQ